MDVQVARLEWIREKEEHSMPLLDTSKPPPGIQPLDPEEIATLIKRGEEFLKNGDIAGAQISLKRAANAGNAQAALEVGMTFDPIFLTQRGVLGFAPDVAQAREWYNRAIKLGSSEASRQLERLAGTGR
jgi:TPR repeat protein